MPRGTPKTYAENIQEMEEYKEYYERRIAKKPLRSPCLEGRLRHYFREPKTRSLTPDLKCKRCGKSVAQVKEEQRVKNETS